MAVAGAYLSGRFLQKLHVHGTFSSSLVRHAFAFHQVRDVLHVTQGQHVAAVRAAGADALLEKLAASRHVPVHAFAKQVAAAEDAFAVEASEGSAVVQQLQRTRLVGRNAVTLVAASCRPRLLQ